MKDWLKNYGPIDEYRKNAHGYFAFPKIYAFSEIKAKLDADEYKVDDVPDMADYEDNKSAG